MKNVTKKKESKLVEKKDGIPTFSMKNLNGYFEDFISENQPYLRSILNDLVQFNDCFTEKDLDFESYLSEGLEIIKNQKPADSVELMLIHQMIVSHRLILECSKGAVLNGQYLNAKNDYLRNFQKMTGTFIKQVQVFSKYKNKGNQTVRVEHVTMNEGSNAVFGDVNSTKSEGGGKKNVS